MLSPKTIKNVPLTTSQLWNDHKAQTFPSVRSSWIGRSWSWAHQNCQYKVDSIDYSWDARRWSSMCRYHLSFLVCFSRGSSCLEDNRYLGGSMKMLWGLRSSALVVSHPSLRIYGRLGRLFKCVLWIKGFRLSCEGILILWRAGCRHLGKALTWFCWDGLNFVRKLDIVLTPYHGGSHSNVCLLTITEGDSHPRRETLCIFLRRSQPFVVMSSRLYNYLRVYPF